MSKIISLFIFCVPLFLQAQVTLSVQLPPAGLVQKDQLWNLVLANNSNATQDVTIFLNLQDAVTGQPVLSAGTRNILLGKGIKMLGIRDVQPVQYNYGMSGFNTNYLPLGSYIACYTIARGAGEKVETLTEECVRININPLSPPLLNTPSDKSVLHTVYPQLTWVPPAPLDMFDNLNYDIAVAEILEGQSAKEAILYNTPVYTKGHLKVPYENYPSSYSRLQAGKTYAWQVTARNGLNYAATTDVWTFSIAKDSAKTEAINDAYVLLRNNSDESGINYIPGNNLKIKYYSFDKEHEIVIRFLNAEGKMVQQKKQKIIYGDNFLHFELNNHFRQGEIYFVEITDQQNKKYKAFFSIK
ncbi:MAG TPA: hypothetical protein VF487_15385 [Chitinophagaceae bacterium]